MSVFLDGKRKKKSAKETQIRDPNLITHNTWLYAKVRQSPESTKTSESVFLAKIHFFEPEACPTEVPKGSIKCILM